MFFLRKRDYSIPVCKEIYSLGTNNIFKVYGKSAEKAIDASIKKLYKIDNKMSVFKSYSEITRVNEFGAKTEQQVSKETYFVIKKALHYSSISDGAFNPMIRPIMHLWTLAEENKVLPKEDEVKEQLKLTNYRDIELKDKQCSIKLKYENQSLDLGGIAKGYAADVVKETFDKYEIKNALIDLGGNIYALGKKPDGNEWSIGIQDPLNTRGEYIGIVSVSNKSVVTSGNYERYFEIGSKKYGHIINPATGYPIENGIISTTIISDNSIDGDGFSTCAYILGVEKSLKLIEETPGVDAVIVTKDRKVYSTSGVEGEFYLTNIGYTRITERAEAV